MIVSGDYSIVATRYVPVKLDLAVSPLARDMSINSVNLICARYLLTVDDGKSTLKLG